METAPELTLTPPKPRARQKNPARGEPKYAPGERGFDAGPWPTRGPFTVKHRAGSTGKKYYHLHRIPAKTAPESGWPVFLARTFGPGSYRIEWRDEAGTDQRSLFEITERLASRLSEPGNPLASAADRRAAAARRNAPELDDDETADDETDDAPRPRYQRNPAPVDPIEQLEHALGLADRLKEIAVRENPPPPPPSALAAMAEKLAPMLVPLLAQHLQAAKTAKPNPPPAAAPIPAGWDPVIKALEALGHTPDAIAARLRQELDARAAAELESGTDDPDSEFHEP